MGLIIDPKRELGDFLHKLSTDPTIGTHKRLARITAERSHINIMSSEKWSLGTLIRNDCYWGAARKILQRIATLTHSNPAIILLGQPPPTSNDPYWPQEATILATTVIAVALEFFARPEATIDFEFDDNHADKVEMWNVARDRLYVAGMRMGMFEDRWKGILDAAEIEVHDDPYSMRRTYRPAQRGKENHGVTTGWEVSPPEVQDAQYARTCTISRLLECLQSERLPTSFAGLPPAMEEDWNKSGKSETDFDRILREFETSSFRPPGARTSNALAFSATLCDELFALTETQRRDDADASYTPLHALSDRFDTVSNRRKAGGSDEYAIVAEYVKKYADMRNTVEKQYAGIYGSATTIWQELTSSEVKNAIFFGCEPLRRGELTEQRLDLVDFTKYIERDAPEHGDEPGVFFIFQPDPDGLDNLIAKICKVMYFEAIIGSRKRARYGEEMPLAAYVADEFHRFVTADRVHGEQSFLDVCRSYGAFTVIACQSIASLRYALCNVETDESKRASAIDIICNNTATKIFFRTTDKDTADRLDTICPSMPDGVVVARVRPLSTLAPGECYASFPDGRFERVQLGMVRQPALPEHIMESGRDVDGTAAPDRGPAEERHVTSSGGPD